MAEADPKYAQYVGTVLPPGKPFTVPADQVRKFTESVGDLRPEYLQGNPAPPIYASAYLARTMNLGAALGSMQKFVKRLDKVVHGSQTYEFFEPVRAGDSVTTSGKLTHIEEKGGKLWVTFEMETQNQHGKRVSRSNLTFVVREGGF